MENLSILFKKLKDLFLQPFKVFSLFLEKKKRIFTIFLHLLDFNTRFIAVFLANPFFFGLYCLALFLVPIAYHPELMKYYTYIHEAGFTFFSIIYGIFKYMPFLFQVVVLSFYMLLFVFCITVPLLLVDCLTHGLYQKYGENVLKKRGCNTRAHAGQKIMSLALCFICGQDTAGRVIAHKEAQTNWTQVQREHPNASIPQPKYTSALDTLSGSIASVFDSIRKQK